MPTSGQQWSIGTTDDLSPARIGDLTRQHRLRSSLLLGFPRAIHFHLNRDLVFQRMKICLNNNGVTSNFISNSVKLGNSFFSICFWKNTKIYAKHLHLARFSMSPRSPFLASTFAGFGASSCFFVSRCLGASFPISFSRSTLHAFVHFFMHNALAVSSWKLVEKP